MKRKNQYNGPFFFFLQSFNFNESNIHQHPAWDLQCSGPKGWQTPDREIWLHEHHHKRVCWMGSITQRLQIPHSTSPAAIKEKIDHWIKHLNIRVIHKGIYLHKDRAWCPLPHWQFHYHNNLTHEFVCKLSASLSVPTHPGVLAWKFWTPYALPKVKKETAIIIMNSDSQKERVQCISVRIKGTY